MERKTIANANVTIDPENGQANIFWWIFSVRPNVVELNDW